MTRESANILLKPNIAVPLKWLFSGVLGASECSTTDLGVVFKSRLALDYSAAARLHTTLSVRNLADIWIGIKMKICYNGSEGMGTL